MTVTIMSRIFITGSSDGLGLAAAQYLLKKGHTIVLHARNPTRALDAQKACPSAESCLIGDLSSITATKKLAEDINASGPFDAIIYNAGLYRGGFKRTEDGLPSLIAVNTMAAYILTCLVSPRPKRMVYLSSALHAGGDASLEDVGWKERGEKRWSDGQAYADSKLHNILLAKAVARRWEGCNSNVLDPGWVATKMGGASAPGDLNAAIQTYEFLATEMEGSGKYYRPRRQEGSPKREVDDEKVQDKLLTLCEEVTGVKFLAS
jgi:NAD(P)-dependent dehydrogenase (short-subunit alcohol dehydrogenase family)